MTCSLTPDKKCQFLYEVQRGVTPGYPPTHTEWCDDQDANGRVHAIINVLFQIVHQYIVIFINSRFSTCSRWHNLYWWTECLMSDMSFWYRIKDNVLASASTCKVRQTREASLLVNYRHVIILFKHFVSKYLQLTKHPIICCTNWLAIIYWSLRLDLLKNYSATFPDQLFCGIQYRLHANKLNIDRPYTLPPPKWYRLSASGACCWRVLLVVK